MEIIVTLAALIAGAAVGYFLASRRVYSLHVSLSQAREKAAALEAQKQAQVERLEEQGKELARIQEQVKLQFEAVASRLFEEHNTKFASHSEKKLSELLNPLKERLGEFQKKVDDSFGSHAKEQFALKKEIERITTVHQQMTLQTESLTKALRGDVRAQGSWGEIILEKILADSGLRRDEDYVLQGSELGLRGEEGNALKPDVIIKLPDGKHVIVDSKVALVHYERYCKEEDETQRALHLKSYLSSVRTHVQGLEQKRYQDIGALGTPDFVLLFMPIEGAYSLAVQQDQELHAYAWNRKIVIVCPSTLFATLRTIASLWRIERQNRNVQEIARQGGQLYDKFVGFLKDMQDIGAQLERLDKTYDEAFKKLKSGRGNLITQAEKLKALGAKVSKSLPHEFTTEDANDAADETGLALLKRATAS